MTPQATTPQAGAKPTFEAVFERNFEQLVRLARFLIGAPDLAEEAVQEAFGKLYAKWSHVRNPDAYVKTAVVNRCRDINRRRRLEERVLRLRGREPNTPPDGEYLADALMRLPDTWREVVVLRYYAGMTLTDIAALLGRPVGTVNSAHHRSLALLRKEFEND